MSDYLDISKMGSVLLYLPLRHAPGSDGTEACYGKGFKDHL